MNQQHIDCCWNRTQEAWEGRNAAYKTCSKQYQRTQRRFLTLAMWPEQRFLIFRELAQIVPWAPSTQAAYWEGVVAMLTALGATQSHDLRNLRWLEQESAQVQPKAAPPLRLEHIQAILHAPVSEAAVAILLTWFLGQRLSDIALLQPNRIRVQSKEFISITFVEGKVIRKIRPYSLFLPVDHFLTTWLLRLASSRTGGTRVFNAALDIETRLLLKAIDETLEARSVRRGGLQMMALSGWPRESILMFSKHASVAMLNKYLDAGALILHDAQKQAQVIWSTTSSAQLGE